MEEIEALKAIYANDSTVKLCEEVCGRFFALKICINLRQLLLTDEVETDVSNLKLQDLLFVITIAEIVSQRNTPKCELHASWLRGPLKMELNESFERLTIQNQDQDIQSFLLFWIENIKEFILTHRQEILLQLSDDVEKNQKDLEEKKAENDFISSLKIHSGNSFVDRKSVFQAHICSIDCVEQVELVLKKLKSENKKVSSATHNIMAYRLFKVPSMTGIDHGEANVNKNKRLTLQNYDDDGEHGAGAKLLQLLVRGGVENVVVVVSRWFGGIKLGPMRFRHINNTAKALLEKHLYLSHKK